MESMWFYKYALRYYDECDNEEKYEIGITVGESTADALERLTQMYGKDFYDLELTYLGECEDCIYKEDTLLEFMEWRMEHLEREQEEKN